MQSPPVNKIFDKNIRLGILPNAEKLQLPRIPRPPEKTPLLQKEIFDDDIDGNFPSGLRLDINKTHQGPVNTYASDNVYLRSSSSTVSTTKGQLGAPIFEKLFNAVKDNSSNLINLIIVAIILVTENLVKGNLFTCPCEQPSNIYYGTAFLAAPAVALFVAGIMINNTTWMLATGCLSRRETEQKSIISNCHHVCGICLRAMVAPFAWLIVGFIDGKFYQCAADNTPCEVNEHELNLLRAESQLIGYVTLMVSMIVAIVGALLHRSTRKLNYEQDRYVRIYRDVERQVIQEAFSVHARDRARQNIQEFLANEDKSLNSQKDWDRIAEVTKSNQRFYTPSGKSMAMSGLEEQIRLSRKDEKETHHNAACASASSSHSLNL